MIDRLADRRLLAVTGTSGSGKSSLVRAGLLEALEMGLLANAGRAWRFAILRPGAHPLEELARALLHALGLGADHARVDGVPDRGPLSIIEELRDRPLADGANLLILVDQFEELFRFQGGAGYQEAETFAAVLLASRQQRDIPIYVVLTMRADFLGDCAQFEDLAEAINESLYLCPRLRRDQLIAAIENPAKVFGGDVEAALIIQLLEDMGANPDQLPLMQHVLSQLWDQAKERDPDRPLLSLRDYLNDNGLKGSLSLHADRIFDTVIKDDATRTDTARRLFCLLTDGESAERAVRRPMRVKEAMEVTGEPLEKIASIADPFRGPSFLMPPSDRSLREDTVLDICHESLIRQWERIAEWVRIESNSAEQYHELERRAQRWRNIKGGEKEAVLLTGADLDLVLAWRDRERPNAAWAARYGSEFALAMQFLDASEAHYEAAEAARRVRELHILELEQRARTAEERVARRGPDSSREKGPSDPSTAAVFVSFSQLDQQLADEIKSTLIKLGFEQVFFDFDKNSGISAGEAWEKRLYEELSRCHATILVLTPNWLASKWCFAELAQSRYLGKMIVPVIFEPVDELFVLPEIQDNDLIYWNSAGRDRIAHRLRSITEELASHFTFDPLRAPYPGLRAFEPEDAAVFFGRDDETRAVVERLNARLTQGGARLLVIVGASGVGKSSLLQAGVLPGLGRHSTQCILFPAMRPGRAPLEALARIVAEMRGEPHGWRVWHERLIAPMAVEELSNVVRDRRVGSAGAATAVLPIDQLEELFTIAEENERAAFLRLMAATLDPGRDLPIIVVATLRSDMLQGLLSTNELAPLTEAFALSPIPLVRIPRLIEGPASVASLRVEPDLVEAILRDVQTPDALPFLAYTLRLIYDNCVGEGRLTLADYLSVGDIQNALRRSADDVFARIDPSSAELAAFRVASRGLVRLREGRPVRQPMRVGSLPREAERLIDALIDARLLTVRAEDDGEPIIEVTHEALFTAWPTFASWIAEDVRDLELRDRLQEEAREWRAAPRRDQPWRLRRGGLPLAEARALAARWGNDLPSEIREFVVASSRAALRRRLPVYVAFGVFATAGVSAVLASIIWLTMTWWGVRQVEANMKFVPIPAGCFEMGSPDSEVDRYPIEGPVHRVCVTAFDLAKYPVTQGEWRRVMIFPNNPNPFYFTWNDSNADRLPAETVSWYDVHRFLWLMNLFGHEHYRLPSEAEMEYATRAGTLTLRYWGNNIDDACTYGNIADESLKKETTKSTGLTANCNDGYGYQTAPVGAFKPNPWGLYDVLGNVLNWTEDCYVNNYRSVPTDGSPNESGPCTARVVRGAAFDSTPGEVRSAVRNGAAPGTRSDALGFRVAKTIPP
jgi:formylglycine-generating enzyme required for sulfatase activity/energy-coupling factor transporter ATP-binding protein EcfA2